MSAATEQYLRYLRLSAAESSAVARRRALARMEAAIGKPLLEATAAELLAWREGLRTGPGTISNYVAHARGFWAWALAEGLAQANLAAGLPVPPVPQLLPRPAADEDVLAAVTGAAQPVRVMLVLAGWCGLRAQEIAFLRRSSVLDKATPPAILITVRAAKGWRERIVPMAPFAVQELMAYGLPPSGWVIRRKDGQPGPNQPHRVSQLCNTYLHEYGIADTLHQWRHWFATSMYQQTRDLRMVQGLLGHASPSTTAGYAKYDQAAAAIAAAALPVPGLRSVILWRTLRLVDCVAEEVAQEPGGEPGDQAHAGDLPPESLQEAQPGLIVHVVGVGDLVALVDQLQPGQGLADVDAQRGDVLGDGALLLQHDLHRIQVDRLGRVGRQAHQITA